MRSLSCLSLIIVVLFLNTLIAGESLTFKDFFSADRLGSPVVSSDGEHIAFTVKKANIPENNYSTQIWLMNSNGTEIRQFTSHTSSSTNPVFSHDNKSLYFLTNRSGNTQIWMKAISTGEVKQVTDIYGDLGGFIISPSNDHFIAVRKIPPNCMTEDCIKAALEEKETSPVKARIIDHLMYRHWNEWLEGNYSHLFLVSADGKNINDITPGEFHTPTIALGSSHDYCFSPDGNEIAYVTNKNINASTSTNNDIYILNLKSDQPAKISLSLGNDNNPQYSADGKYIAYLSMERAGFEADRQRIMVYDRRTTKTIELTSGFTLSVTDLRWAPGNKEIYFTTEEAGYSTIYKVSLSTNMIESVLSHHDVKGIQFTTGNRLVFIKQTTQMPYEIYIYDINNSQLTQITHFNDEVLAKFDLPPSEEFWFIGAQGDSVQGFIMKPPHYKEGKKYPAVHMIHGGPQGMWSDEWHFRWSYQMFAAPGYAVFYINFHGSRGYGQKFTDSITQHWGDLPYEDLVKGTNFVLNNYDFVDPDRLAAAGASYGGFMVNWIAGHKNPYKCLVSHDGSYDQKSMWGETEELWFPEWEMGGLPWEKGTTYEKWSPARLAPNFKTPMLVIHGEHDYRLAYTQSLQLFTALQRQGVPSRLLFFPDEDHFVRKPLNAQLWWKTVHGWLEKYLVK